MFNTKKEEQPGEFETVIGPSVKVEGDFVSEGNVIVQGLVNGSLKTSRFVVVTGPAKITADLTAANARIAGEVNGNVKVADRLELTGSARVNGDIDACILSVEAGAKFNGKCSMIDNASRQRAEPAVAS